MSEQMTVEDLPDEMLEMVFSYLELEDRKSAALVCRTWEQFALRWSTIQLVVDFRKPGQEEYCHRTLLGSQRPYKNLVFHFGYDNDKYELLVDILSKFSQSVESLTIMPNNFIPVELGLAAIATMCPNLRHLHVDACTFSNGSAPDRMELKPMNNLRELYLENNLLNLLPDMWEITPNITSLHMQISYYSQRPQKFLQHFSPRLTELEIWFLTEDHFFQVCEMGFPMLEKLNLYCVDASFETEEAVNSIGRLFQESTRLREVTLRCNVNAAVLEDIGRWCRNLQFLCLSMDSFTAGCFFSVSCLKHLRSLRLEDALIHAPEPEFCPKQESLHRLSLYGVQFVDAASFNRLICHMFPRLAVLELLQLCYRLEQKEVFKLYGDVCGGIPSLNRLVLSEPNSFTNLQQLLRFCGVARPKELRLKSWSLVENAVMEDPKSIPISKLVLDVPQLKPAALWQIMHHMSELRRLEFGTCELCTKDVIRSIRTKYARCDVVSKRKVQIEERL